MNWFSKDASKVILDPKTTQPQLVKMAHAGELPDLWTLTRLVAASAEAFPPRDRLAPVAHALLNDVRSALHRKLKFDQLNPQLKPQEPTDGQS